MPAYKYSVQIDNKITSGIITSSSLSTAKDNLIHLGYEILSIVPVEEQHQKPSNKRTFSFEAYNKEGKKVVGTIKTLNEETAQKKLEQSHHLQHISLTDITPGQESPKQEKEEKNNQDIIERGKKAIQKAEDFLETISVYDRDYNTIFDAKEEIRYHIKDNNLQKLDEEINSLLSLVHEKETSAILTEKEMEEETVAQTTSGKISTIKSETQQVIQTPYNFYVNTILSELQILTQWLLVFYAFYFVGASLLAEKYASFTQIGFIQNTLTSPLLFKIALSLIWITILCRIKLYFFENKLAFGIGLSVITCFLILWTFLI